MLFGHNLDKVRVDRSFLVWDEAAVLAQLGDGCVVLSALGLQCGEKRLERLVV